MTCASTRRGPDRLCVLGLALLALCTAGCVRGCKSSRSPIHLNPNMDYQPKYQAQESSDFFYDGAAMREPVPGTVARGELEQGTPRLTGRDATGVYLAVSPLAVDTDVESRGAERYAIYCAPCHGKRGMGQGILYERAGVPTPSFHDDKYRAYPDGQIFDVITNGLGLMPAYRYPIPPDDRWAIVSHVRHLQRERQASRIALAGR